MVCEIKYQFFLPIDYKQYKGYKQCNCDVGDCCMKFMQHNPLGLDIFLVFAPYEAFNYWYLCYQDVIGVDIACTPFEYFLFNKLKRFCKIDGYSSRATRSIRYCDYCIKSIQNPIISFATVNKQFAIECDPYYRWAVHEKMVL